MAQQSKRHHYIPVFYLEAWTGADRQLCEISRPRGKAVAKRVAPRATGFQRHLYTVAGLPSERQTVLEDEFFRDLDRVASDALRFMTDSGSADWPRKFRIGWARFVLSFQHRNPEKVAGLKSMSAERLEILLEEIKDRIGTDEIPSLPLGMSFEQFSDDMRLAVRDRTWAEVLLQVVESPRAGLFVANMRWHLITIEGGADGFLTSDRPLLMTNGIDQPEGEIILPVSPTRLFVAINTPEQEARLTRIDPELLRRMVNDKICRQAQQFVYSVNDSQLRFADNRLRRPSAQA